MAHIAALIEGGKSHRDAVAEIRGNNDDDIDMNININNSSK